MRRGFRSEQAGLVQGRHTIVRNRGTDGLDIRVYGPAQELSLIPISPLVRVRTP
ncbi:MAG: hypothetical protein HY078_07385 [Elusimicrobia bacterium]|nr:hypothetical protein [Elusimicrobiota bacterium]